MRKSPNWELLNPFLLTLAATLIIPHCLPFCRLTFFAPFLVITCYRVSLHQTLWWALACGTTLDLIGGDGRLGIVATSFCLATWLLFWLKKHFFEDNLSTIPIMTGIFSLTTTLLHAVLGKIFASTLRFSFGWLITDMIFMPALDVIYAFVFFTLPKLSQRGSQPASHHLPADRPQ